MRAPLEDAIAAAPRSRPSRIRGPLSKEHPAARQRTRFGGSLCALLCASTCPGPRAPGRLALRPRWNLRPFLYLDSPTDLEISEPMLPDPYQERLRNVRSRA